VFGGPWRRRGTGPRGGIIGLIIAIIAILIAVIVIAVNAHSGMSVSHKGPCMGGPVLGATGEPVGNGNFRFPCADGGSTVVHLGG
jgi:hypothetical protein